jgi:hypothetical protein
MNVKSPGNMISIENVLSLQITISRHKHLLFSCQ